MLSTLDATSPGAPSPVGDLSAVGGLTACRHLLEIGELADLHPVDGRPDLPARPQAPSVGLSQSSRRSGCRAASGSMPMPRPEGCQILLWLSAATVSDYLELVVVLQPVGVSP